MNEKMDFILNNRPVSVEADPLKRLLDVLREDFGLAGVKEGCGEGECGACAVLVDGRLVNSCLTPLAAVEGKQVTTIEGLTGTDSFRMLEKCFADAGAVQCGFCIPGMIMAAEALLRQDPHPAEYTIREAVSGNLCRCTGYNAIIEAIQAAAEKGDGLW